MMLTQKLNKVFLPFLAAALFFTGCPEEDVPQDEPFREPPARVAGNLVVTPVQTFFTIGGANLVDNVFSAQDICAAFFDETGGMALSSDEALARQLEFRINDGAPHSWNDTYAFQTAGDYSVVVSYTDGGGILKAPPFNVKVAADWLEYDADDFGADASVDNTFTVGSAAEWANAVQTINAGGNGAVDSAKNYTIYLTGDFDIPGAANATWTPQYIKVSIRGNKKIGLSNTSGSVLNIAENQSVILRGAHIVGVQNNNAPAVKVEGEFTLQYGSITGNSCNIGNGVGGVILDGAGGNQNPAVLPSFTMNGGAISGNGPAAASNQNIKGGGIAVRVGVFTMNGGSISGNTAYGGGGILLHAGGKFVMTGGEISENAAAAGAGILLDDWSSAEFKGGRIYCNTASDGAGLGTGGGIQTRNTANTLNIEAIDIRGNKALGDNDDGGGGIMLYAGEVNFTPVQDGGIIFEGNSTTAAVLPAKNGGNVHRYTGSLKAGGQDVLPTQGWQGSGFTIPLSGSNGWQY